MAEAPRYSLRRIGGVFTPPRSGGEGVNSWQTLTFKVRGAKTPVGVCDRPCRHADKGAELIAGRMCVEPNEQNRHRSVSILRAAYDEDNVSFECPIYKDIFLMSFKGAGQPKEASGAAFTGCFEILTESSGDKLLRMSCFTFTFWPVHEEIHKRKVQLLALFSFANHIIGDLT